MALGLRHNLSVRLGTNCAPLLPISFFCNESDFMRYMYLAIVIERMVHRIYQAEFQLNKANSFDTEASFLCLNFPLFN